MRGLLSTHGLPGEVESMVGLAARLRELGAEVPVMPIGRRVRPLVTGAMPSVVLL